MKYIKKILSVCIISVILISSFTSVNSKEDINVTLDGTELTFDVSPQIIDNWTLVPFRKIFESLGSEVSWDGETQTITAIKDERVIKMTVGSNIMYVNSNEVMLDISPQIIDDRTLVPVRAISNAFDCDIQWNADSRTVIIETPLLIQPSPSVSPTEKYSIEYDSESERLVLDMKNFEITDIKKNTDGNYDITYTLETYLEGRGTVEVKFICLDENNNTVDSFSKIFIGTDYTWTPHKGSTATISDKTTLIKAVSK